MKCVTCEREAVPNSRLCDECTSKHATHLARIQPTATFVATDRGPNVDAEQTIQSTPSQAGARAGSTNPPSQPTYSGFSNETNQAAERFTLTEVLGEGGQGQVCRAFDNHLQRAVAIKFPRQATEAEAKGILDEARKAARLNHPNVVTIYECGLWQGRPFICMELVDGTSLASLLKDVGRISPAAFVRYAQQILRALEAAHASGLVHRDLKPHNILQAKDGTLKLTDFGIAQAATSGRQIDQKTGMIMVAGTPAYMAPELWRGKNADKRSDIYAFGCVAYELLTGRQPFPAREKDLARMHLEVTPPPLRDIVPSIPITFERVVMQCLDKNPADRFSDAQAVRESIEQAARQEQISETLSVPAPKKSGGGLKVAAAVVLVGGAAAFFAVHPNGKALWSRWTGAADQTAEKPSNDARSNGKSDTDEPTNGTPAPAENDAARRALEEQLRIGRENLAKAGDASLTAVDRKAFAEKAKELLAGEERRDAERLIGAIESELAKITEKQATESYDAVLKGALDAKASPVVAERVKKIEEAERMMAAIPVLNTRQDEVVRAKLPVFSEYAAAFEDEGDFDAAGRWYEEAAKAADRLDKDLDKQRLRQKGEQMNELEILKKLSTRQPRFALLQMQKRLAADAKGSGSLYLLARTQAHLGLDAAAKVTLDACAAAAKSDAMKQRVAALKSGLN